MSINNEIPDSLRIKLDSAVKDNFLMSETELDSLLLVYPNSDYLLAQKINLLIEDNVPETDKFIKTMNNPGTFVLSEIAAYYAWTLNDIETAQIKWRESILKDERNINWLCRMYFAELLGIGENIGIPEGPELSDKYFNDALEISPNNPRVLLAWARISLINGQLDKGSHLLSLVPEDYDPVRRFNIEGLLWSKKNNLNKARHCFQKALEIDSSNLEVIINFAKLEDLNGNHSTAEKILQPWIKIYPNTIDVNLTYGYILLHLRKYTEAISIFENLLTIGNVPLTRSFYRIAIAEAYIGLHQYNKAEESLLTARRDSATIEVEAHLLVVHTLMKKDTAGEFNRYLQMFTNEGDERYLHIIFNKFLVELPERK